MVAMGTRHANGVQAKYLYMLNKHNFKKKKNKTTKPKAVAEAKKDYHYTLHVSKGYLKSSRTTWATEYVHAFKKKKNKAG